MATGFPPPPSYDDFKEDWVSRDPARNPFVDYVADLINWDRPKNATIKDFHIAIIKWRDDAIKKALESHVHEYRETAAIVEAIKVIKAAIK